MNRSLLLAFVLVVLVMAGFHFVLDLTGALPHGAGVDFRLGHRQLPARTILATWLLEALALVALSLLIEGRLGRWWLDGLAVGWIAWVFRGPLLVITAAGAARLDPSPWWRMSARWFLLYTLCGLIVAGITRPRPTAPAAEPAPAEDEVPAP